MKIKSKLAWIWKNCQFVRKNRFLIDIIIASAIISIGLIATIVYYLSA
jgi:hypothetical protein